MKKKAITLLLSLVLASGSIGISQVLAADTTGQEAEPVQEEEPAEQEENPVQEEEPAEEADTENASEDVGEPEEEEEAVQENEEQVQEDGNSETKEALDGEYFDTSEDAAADVLETEETEITDESEDALADVVDSGTFDGDYDFRDTPSHKMYYTLTGAGDDLTLTISGKGYMNFNCDGDRYLPPWAKYSNRITKVITEDGVISLDYELFSGYTNLKSVELSANTWSIDEGAFSGCINLRNINIPDRVSSIGESAFRGCSNLTGITIPDSVTSIGAFAFNGCSTLTSITIPDRVTGIGEYTFGGCSSLKSITIPENVSIIGEGAFMGCKSLTGITIPDGVTNIAGYTFSGCSSLTGITIPDSVMSIRGYSFYGCKSLKNITIPDNITSIKWHTFQGCSSLTNIILPEELKEINDFAFEGCSNLKSIVIPDGVTTIKECAFSGCSSLPSINIPENVNYIGPHAFRISQETPITILTTNQYVIDYCKSCGYKYFNNTAPAITKLSGQNGSDIWVNIGKREDATGYHIKYSENSDMTNSKEIMFDGKDTSSKAISGLTNEKTYYVRVQIYKKTWDTTYWSKWSPVQSVIVTQTPYKTPISKLSTFIGSHIKVDWNKTPGASGYHIKYADNSSMTGAKEVMVKGNNTFTKTLTGLKNGKTYYVRIQTYRTVSGKTYWSSWSDVKSIMVDQKPYGSSISKLTNPSSKAMKITWDKASSASGYHIQYSTNSSMTGAKDIMVNNKDTLSKTVTGLTKGKTYYVRIQTFRKVSGKTYWSSWSKAKQIKITK